MLNPSYAGFGRSNSVWSNMLFSAEPDNQLKHTFTVTYDKWSDKMKGGLAFYFYQGLDASIHTNYTGTGFTVARPLAINDSEIIASFNLNYYFFTKQWLVYVIDGILDKSSDPYNPPGVSFMRYNILNPRMGLLLNTSFMTLGATVSYAFKHHLAHENKHPHDAPFLLVVHAENNYSGHENGLLFRPFDASPEAVVIYSNNLLVTRFGFRKEQVDRLLGFYVQNNFTSRYHGITGLYGWKTNNFRIALTLGGAYSIPSAQTMFFGEASVGLVIPYKFQNGNNPWAPPFISL